MPQNYADDINIDLVVPKLCASHTSDLWSQISGTLESHVPIPKAAIKNRLNKISSSENSPFMGDGILSFHIKSVTMKKPFASLFTTDTPMDMQAADGIDVDIFYVLFTPRQFHGMALRRMARMTRLLKSAEIRQRLREETSADAIHGILSQSQQSWTLVA